MHAYKFTLFSRFVFLCVNAIALDDLVAPQGKKEKYLFVGLFFCLLRVECLDDVIGKADVRGVASINEGYTVPYKIYYPLGVVTELMPPQPPQ